MKILADNNIPGLFEWFGQHGEVCAVPGSEINTSLAKEADALLVRSVTSVTEDLVKHSRLSFVGSCTIGTDHVDQNALKKRQIAFCHALGCNANAVSEYVLQMVLSWAHKTDKNLDALTTGIVGFGHVGKRVHEKLEALGIRCLLNDPLLEGCPELDEILKCNIITLHTPLTRTGPFKTWRLLDESRLKKISPNALLINTARGAVVDNDALKDCPASIVLDVWENEPDINADLLDLCWQATPHIAGHSCIGKWQGSLMVYEQFLKHFKINAQLPRLAGDFRHHLTITGPALSVGELLKLLKTIQDLSGIDAKFREALKNSPNIKSAFEQCRKNYPQRSEFSECCITAPDLSLQDKRLLKKMGFFLPGSLSGKLPGF